MTHFEEIDNKIGVIIVRDYPTTTAQTAANFGVIATLPFPFEILSVSEKHTVAGSDAGAVTLDVLYVPDGSAIASGTSILASTFDLKSTANTTVLKSGLDLTSARGFDPKDSIALKTSGVLTALEGVQVTIYIKPLNRGEFK